MVGEPEAAMGVEDQVVGSAQRVAVALLVQNVDLARLDVDPLDPAAASTSREAAGAGS